MIPADSILLDCGFTVEELPLLRLFFAYHELNDAGQWTKKKKVIENESQPTTSA